MSCDPRPALVQAFNRMPKESVTYHYIQVGAEAPIEGAPSLTDTEKVLLGVVGSPKTEKYPPGQGDARGLKTLTVLANQIAREPSQSDRFEVGGYLYNVERVDTHADTLYVIHLAGPMLALPAEGADTTPPSLVSASATGLSMAFEYSAEFSEASEHRLRWRTPPAIGGWRTYPIDGGWRSGGYLTSVTDWSIDSLPTGNVYYDVEIQMRDAAGNVSPWNFIDRILVAGTPQQWLP